MAGESKLRGSLQKAKAFLKTNRKSPYWRKRPSAPSETNAKIGELVVVLDFIGRQLEDIIDEIFQLHDAKAHRYLALTASVSATPDQYIEVHDAIIHSLRAQLAWLRGCLEREIELVGTLKDTQDFNEQMDIVKRARHTIVWIDLINIGPKELNSPVQIPAIPALLMHKEDECLNRLGEVVAHATKRLSTLQGYSRALMEREIKGKGHGTCPSDSVNSGPILGVFRILVWLLRSHITAHESSASKRMEEMLQPLEKLLLMSCSGSS